MKILFIIHGRIKVCYAKYIVVYTRFSGVAALENEVSIWQCDLSGPESSKFLPTSFSVINNSMSCWWKWWELAHWINMFFLTYFWMFWLRTIFHIQIFMRELNFYCQKSNSFLINSTWELINQKKKVALCYKVHQGIPVFITAVLNIAQFFHLI